VNMKLMLRLRLHTSVVIPHTLHGVEINYRGEKTPEKHLTKIFCGWKDGKTGSGLSPSAEFAMYLLKAPFSRTRECFKGL
jgi:hypothetical protein